MSFGAAKMRISLSLPLGEGERDADGPNPQKLQFELQKICALEVKTAHSAQAV